MMAEHHFTLLQRKAIMEKLENKNPGDNNGSTPLHFAARFGHLDVCSAIMEKLDNKNPMDNDGQTPLQYAVNSGNLEVYSLYTVTYDFQSWQK